MIDFATLRAAGENIRVHGNGFIQIDIPDGRARVHVFGHPLIPRQLSPTPIHDHRFGFHSAVLRGCLVNVDWKFHGIGRAHTHVVWEARPNEGEDTSLVSLHRSGWVDPVRTRTICARESYIVNPREFHETFANEPTVTVMTKTGEVPDHRPRVLCRVGQTPDNSFTRYRDEDKLWDIVRESFG
jgi:hypothetical protein